MHVEADYDWHSTDSLSLKKLSTIHLQRLSSKLTEGKDVDCDATNVSDAASLPTPEDKVCLC